MYMFPGEKNAHNQLWLICTHELTTLESTDLVS